MPIAKKIIGLAAFCLFSRDALAGGRFDWLWNCLFGWRSVSGQKAEPTGPASPAKPRPPWERPQRFDGRQPYDFLPTVSVAMAELDRDLAQLLGPNYREVLLAAEFAYPHTVVEQILDRYASAPPEALYLIGKLSKSQKPEEQAAGRLLEKIVELYDAQDPVAALYFEKLGHNRAIKLGQSESTPVNAAFDWPEPPAGVEGEYWDMASGLYALEHSQKFKTDRRYRLFDANPYVSRQMATRAQINGLNLAVEQRDVRFLAKPDKPIAVLRVKNAATYAKGFEKNLLTMADWIAPNGHLLLQEDTLPVQLARTVHRFGPAVKELMRRGWKFEFHGYMKPYYYNTLRLIRPEKEAPVDPAEVERQWNAFLQSEPILAKGDLGQYEKNQDD